jgi:ketosteroid isomerase-like protein
MSYRYLSIILIAVLGTFLTSSVAEAQNSARPQSSASEQVLWNLERSYWRYVQDNDLAAYRNLWNKDFLGWPSVSDAPVHKDHITDWITSQTSKGLVFKTIEFKPAAMQVNGDIAVAYYWVTYSWTDKAGSGEPRTTRVAHTWNKDGKAWRIIGGMSMPQPLTASK